MKVLKNVAYLVMAAMLSVSMWSCNNDPDPPYNGCDDDCQDECCVDPPVEELKVYMDWAASFYIKEGDVLEFSPVVTPEEGVTFSWTINGTEIANTRELNHTVTETADFVLRFEATFGEQREYRVADATVLFSGPFVPQPHSLKSVAFVSAATVTMADIQWEQITHLVWSAAIVQNDGSVTFQGFNRADFSVRSLISTAHRNGVFVLLDVAGVHDPLQSGHLYGQRTFYTAIQSPANRAAIIEHVLARVDEYGFDGINVYFDRPSDGAFGNVAAVRAFADEIATAVPTASLVHTGQPFFLTMSLFPGWMRGEMVPVVGNPRFDWHNIFAFGIDDLTPNPHSSLWMATDNLEFWLNNGVDANRLVLVAPAFGIDYNFPPGVEITWGNSWQFFSWISFRAILENHPNAHLSNHIGEVDSRYTGLFFDGFPAIDDKADHVRAGGFAGMGIWKADSDVTDQRSLLRRIRSELGN